MAWPGVALGGDPVALAPGSPALGTCLLSPELGPAVPPVDSGRQPCPCLLDRLLLRPRSSQARGGSWASSFLTDPAWLQRHPPWGLPELAKWHVCAFQAASLSQAPRVASETAGPASPAGSRDIAPGASALSRGPLVQGRQPGCGRAAVLWAAAPPFPQPPLPVPAEASSLRGHCPRPLHLTHPHVHSDTPWLTSCSRNGGRPTRRGSPVTGHLGHVVFPSPLPQAHHTDRHSRLLRQNLGCRPPPVPRDGEHIIDGEPRSGW